MLFMCSQLRAVMRAREEELQQANAALLRLAKQRVAEQEQHEAEKRALKEHYAELVSGRRVRPEGVGHG
jgi:hypothetical protein